MFKESTPLIATEQTIDQYSRMPDIIAEVKREALSGDISGTEDRIRGVLGDNNYVLSLRQKMTMIAGLPVYLRQRAGIKNMHDHDSLESVKADLEANIGEAGCVEQIDFHSTSLTFALGSKAFTKAIGDETSLQKARGFTDDSMVIPVRDTEEVRYSLRDAAKSDTSTSDHENQHVAYTYFHPYTLERFPNRNSLARIGNALLRQQNHRYFRQVVKSQSLRQISWYLDELTAYSLNREGALSEFIGPAAGYYGGNYNKRIEALRAGLPSDLRARLPWERIIWKERLRLRHQLKFIEEEYKKIERNFRSYTSTARLTNIVMSLPPDQAYMIRLFNHGKDPVGEDVLDWAREYFNGWMPKTSVGKIQDWADFSIERITAEVPSPSPTREFVDAVQDHKRNLYSGNDEGALDPEDKVKACKELVVGRSALLAAIDEYIKEEVIDNTSKSESEFVVTSDEYVHVKRRVIIQTLNIDQLFHKFVDRYYNEFRYLFSRNIPERPDGKFF